MSSVRQAGVDDGEEAQPEEHIVKKRKEVTTASILENFLLLATSLDDTVREEDVSRTMGEGPASSNHKAGKSKSKSNSNSSTLQTRLVNILNSQRQEARESIREAISHFALEYDTESARLGEEDPSAFEYDPDEQVNLPKERWDIDLAMERLKRYNDETKMESVDLGRTIRQQETSLTRVVDSLVEQRTHGQPQQGK